MPKIKYKIKSFSKSIFVVVVPNSYTRAMLFLRIQEFYESKNKKFKGKKFSFWDYKEWYSLLNNGNFTYTGDWSGFNVPLEVAVKCQKVSKVETPYDEEMSKIIKIIRGKSEGRSYVIGTESMNSTTFKHEIAHALYYTNKEYKKEMNSITNYIGKHKLKFLKKTLRDMGYCEYVLLDEIQAYLSTEKKSKLVKKIVIEKKILKQYRKAFNEAYIKLNFKKLEENA